MKKLMCLLIFLWSMSVVGMVYLDEDFEGGTLGVATANDIDGDGNNWHVTTNPGKAGTYRAESASTGLTPDNELIFPSTWVERGTYLNFWIGSTNSASPEHFEIYFSDDQVDPSNFMLVYEETLSAGEYKQVEIEMNPFFFAYNEWFWDSEISVKVRHYNSEVNTELSSSLIVDDFRIINYPTFSYDEYYFIIPPEIVEPYSDVSMRWAPYDRTMYDVDWNFVGLDNLALHYIITDGTGTQPEQTFPLTANTDIDYEGTYICDFPGQPMGTVMEYWVEAYDNTPYALMGESLHFHVEWGEVNFEEGFEYAGPEVTPPNGWMPDGWVTYQTGEVTSSWDRPWEVDVATQNVHSGEYSVTSASQNNFGEWLTENYIVSPRIRVNGTPMLKYYMNAQTKIGEQYKERWSVLISTVEGDGTDIENFTEIQKDSIIPTLENENTWYEKTFDLSAYENEYVRIMWKHHYTSTAVKLDRFLNMDDVSIAELPALNVIDAGNSADPGQDYTITVEATDYSGINNVTVYYTIEGQPEQALVLTDNGNDSFTGIIPGQAIDTKCSWYAVATDNSVYSNTTTSDSYCIIWFSDGVLEWGSTGTNYDDPADFINGGDKVAIDWNFGMKEFLYLNKIEIGWNYTANNITWKLVEFDPNIGNLDESENPIGAPTDNVIGELQGVHSFAAGGDTLHIENGKNTPIYGHVGLVFQTPVYNEIMLDESGDKSHAWQWNSVTKWTTNLWGAFYIKMYVSQIPNGIENEFVSSTTELCQNYPNPFNPETSISFYNRVAGEVSLTVFNTKGEKVASLISEKMNEGFRKVSFNASGLNSGVYYYTLKTPEKTLTKKMLLVK